MIRFNKAQVENWKLGDKSVIDEACSPITSEIGTTEFVFHPKPKERSQKDRKHRAGPSFKRPNPLSWLRCQYNAGMIKAQKNHISVKSCIVPVTGGIFNPQLGTSHTALALAGRACTLPWGCLLCPAHSLESWEEMFAGNQPKCSNGDGGLCVCFTGVLVS